MSIRLILLSQYLNLIRIRAFNRSTFWHFKVQLSKYVNLRFLSHFFSLFKFSSVMLKILTTQPKFTFLIIPDIYRAKLGMEHDFEFDSKFKFRTWLKIHWYNWYINEPIYLYPVVADSRFFVFFWSGQNDRDKIWCHQNVLVSCSSFGSKLKGIVILVF